MSWMGGAEGDATGSGKGGAIRAAIRDVMRGAMRGVGGPDRGVMGGAMKDEEGGPTVNSGGGVFETLVGVIVDASDSRLFVGWMERSGDDTDRFT